MTAAISLEELLHWDCEAAQFWKSHFEAHPAHLQLPCDIGGNTDVQGLVRHICGVALIWSQRAAGLPQSDRAKLPIGPLEALFEMHREAEANFRVLLKDPATDWGGPVAFNHPLLTSADQYPSRRKVVGHALLHGQRHWAQVATLVRSAGFQTGFMGDLLMSSALA
jgi:uncharacterized damage-inducible protein DinB